MTRTRSPHRPRASLACRSPMRQRPAPPGMRSLFTARAPAATPPLPACARPTPSTTPSKSTVARRRLREPRLLRHPLRSEEFPMRRRLICAAVVAATWTTRLAMRTTLAQTPAAATDSVARVIVKFKPSSTLLRKQALSAAVQQTQQAAALGQRIGVALEAGRGLTDRSHVVLG